jgi:anti-anti-sigma regulatory factor
VLRASGTVDTTRGLGPHDHVCWAYGDVAEFRTHAGQFLTDGLALKQRVCYIGNGTVDALSAELCEVDGMERALYEGAAQVASVQDVYASGTVIEPAAQVAAYAAATDEALAAGFSGLRVAADATVLVQDAAQVEAFARYEHLVDHYMATMPFAALCAYDRAELGRQTVAQVACMHPAVNHGTTAFRLYGCAARTCSAVLAGELDISSADLFPLALRRADPRPRDGEIVLDASDVGFIDHRSLLVLAAHARERDLSVVLRTAHSTPARIVRVLDLTDVRVVAR